MLSKKIFLYDRPHNTKKVKYFFILSNHDHFFEALCQFFALDFDFLHNQDHENINRNKPENAQTIYFVSVKIIAVLFIVFLRDLRANLCFKKL